MATAARPARLFFCYDHEDEELCQKLEAHLSVLERTGVLLAWHRRKITAGQDWAGAIDEELQRADVVLLLISASFLRSDYLYDVEMSRALERHARREALVIPVLVRPVDWEGAPFGALTCLPSNALAVTLWRNMDEAFSDVARGIRRALADRAEGRPFVAADPLSPVDAASQERALDAAVPSHVRVGERVEVLALVATASSGGLRAVLQLEPQSFSVAPEDVRTSRFELVFPVDAHGRPQAATVTVALESPDFAPGQTSKKILVPPHADSTVCTLFVKPVRAGVLSLQLELRLDDVIVWSQRLRTNGTGPGAPVPRSYLLTSVPLSTVSHGAGGGRAAGVAAPPAIRFDEPSGIGPGGGFGPPPPPPPVWGMPPQGPPDGGFGPPPRPPPAGGPSLLGPRPGAPPLADSFGQPPPMQGPGRMSSGATGRKVLLGFLVTFQIDPGGSFWPIYTGRTALGRTAGEGIDIAVQDVAVSSWHASIHVDLVTGQAFVEDDGSRNGTFLNGARLAPGERRQLRDHDRLRLGSITFVVKLIEPDAAGLAGW
jgi:hypothetical protein